MAVEIPVVIDIDKAFEDAAKRVEVAMQPLQRTIEGLTSDLGAWREILNESKINDKDFIEAAKNIQNISERLAEAEYALKKYTENEGSIRSMTSSLAELERRWTEMGSAQKFTDSGGKNLSADAQSLLNQYKNITAEMEKQGKSLAQLAAEENRRIEQSRRVAQQKKYENAVIASTAKTMMGLQKQEQILSDRLRRTPIGTQGFRDLSAQLQQVRKDMAAAEKEIRRASGAYRDIASGADAATTKINATNTSLRRQSGLLSQLGSLAGMYLSVFGGLRFVKNIRDTTAELEMQRVALGGIIQDTDRATELFREIKAAALKSPFEIKDLVTYTKQLSAYRIETDKLFDVTMRLADVSAGLGVDMNRLILAYGQVRAASVLRGQELRQFTEAGIPLVELLADKFKKLGREGTTTADVFELISKRAVPFSMIEEIFNDMTDASGMFYKMQEKQSETLKGQWMKLKDAVTIMYDEIGNTQQVHKAMEDLIKSALSIMRNWRDIARWVATGTASLVTYSVVAKATTVASTALGRAEAMRLAISQKQVVTMPRVIAAIVGEKAAKDANRRATKALIVAQYKLAAANGLLEKTFWKVAVAIAKNPYAAAAAAIAAVGFSIYTLIKNSKEAEVTVESLNSAIAKANDAASSLTETRRLISIYEELSAKSEKTAEEQTKLSRVTRELAKAFPSAVNGLNAQGEALDMNIEKVKTLAELEAKLAAQELKRQAKEAKSQLGTLESEAQRITANLMQVTEHGGLYLGKNLKGEAVFKSIPESKLKKWGDRLREITEKIYEYRTALKKLEDSEFIGPMPQDEGNTTATLATWKKRISEIQSEKVKAGAVQIFSPGDIQNFESVLKFSKELKKKRDELTQSLKTNKELLKTATEDTKESIKADIKADEETLKMVEAMRIALGIIFKSTSTRDTRLSQLKSDISELTNAYKKFTELTKYKTEEEALIDINKMFPQLKDMAPTFNNVVSELERRLADVKAQLARSPKSKTLLDMQRALETEISNLRFDKLKADLDKQLKKLSDEMKRSETARNFYNNILGLTGDEELAASMAVTVYGGFGKDFKQRMQEQLNEALSSISAEARTPDLVNAVAGQDFKTILANLDKFPEKWQEELKKMADDSQKFSADQIQTWLKELNEFKSYGDKRVQLARQTAERIAEINASDLSRSEKQSLISQYRNKEAKEAAKLQYEAFKDSALYVDMFENLDNASVTMLTNMRDRLIELKGQWKNLDPVQLKEMEKRIEEINKQLGTRNPFKMLSEGIKEYQKLQAKGTRAQADQAAMDALKKQVKEEQKLERAVSEVTRAQQAYDLIVASKGENSLEARSAKAVLNAKKKQLGAQKKLADQAKTEADIAQNNANQWQIAADKIQTGAEGIMQYADLAASALKDLNSAFASEADAAYYNEQITNIVKSLESTAKLAVDVAKIIGSEGADISAWVSSAMDIVALVVSIANTINAAKVKKANDEIERQERAISNLEYAYNRLDKAIDESFGNARIYNYTQQVENLTQKRVKLEAELAAERSKGNKASQDAINGYLDKIRETEDALADLKKSQADFWVGQELTSASEAFVDSWIAAKKEFGDTTAAIEETMQGMVENLISKAAMSGVVQAVLKPWYDELNKIEAWDTSTIARMVKDAYDKIPLINQGLEVAYSSLASAGVDIRRSVGNLTGISRNYATASEESILGLTAATNTQNYYMSYVPTINDHVAAIREKIVGNVTPTAATASAEGPSYEDQMLAYASNLPLMRSDTEAIRTMLERVIKPQGTTATHYVSVRM